MSVAVAVLYALIAAGPVTGSTEVAAPVTTATEVPPVEVEALPHDQIDESDVAGDPLGDPFSMSGEELPLAAAGEEAPAEEQAKRVPRRDVADPARTQLMLSPSAHTLGQDESRISATQLTLYQYNFGITDDLQLGINSFIILATSVDLKWRFLHTDQFSAAGLVGIGVVPLNRDIYGAYGRLVGTWHRDDLELSLGWSSLGVRSAADDVSHIGSAMGALTWQIGQRSKFIAEYNAALNMQALFDDEIVNILTWGFRFFWDSFAITPGYISPLDRSLFGPDVIGVPYLDISYSF